MQICCDNPFLAYFYNSTTIQHFWKKVDQFCLSAIFIRGDLYYIYSFHIPLCLGDCPYCHLELSSIHFLCCMVFYYMNMQQFMYFLNNVGVSTAAGNITEPSSGLAGSYACPRLQLLLSNCLPKQPNQPTDIENSSFEELWPFYVIYIINTFFILSFLYLLC